MCELSSYQIADLTIGPEVAVLTNLYREHTDWHGSEEQYRADKLRIFELPGVRAAVRPLGDRGDWPLVVAPDQIPLRGRHNAANVAAAVAAIEAAGLPLPPLPQALEGLTALPHRLQTVHTGRAAAPSGSTTASRPRPSRRSRRSRRSPTGRSC